MIMSPPADPHQGRDILIPCSHCNVALMPLKVEAEVHQLTCPRCSRLTKVTVSLKEGTWSIKSAAV